MSNFKTKLKDVNTFIFDYDGVLTDGTVYLQADGEALRAAFVKDGYAMYLAVRLGFKLIVISGGRSVTMENRLKALKATDFYLGVHNKIKVYHQVLEKYNLKHENVLYMGDDIPDYQVMKEVGVATCPADAVQEIQAVSEYISTYNGGRGAVRDVIEQVLKIHGKWMTDEAFRW